MKTAHIQLNNEEQGVLRIQKNPHYQERRKKPSAVIMTQCLIFTAVFISLLEDQVDI